MPTTPRVLICSSQRFRHRIDGNHGHEPADDYGLVREIADHHNHVDDLVVPVAYTSAIESSSGARRVGKRRGELKPQCQVAIGVFLD
jgi:hypothetical protein